MSPEGPQPARRQPNFIRFSARVLLNWVVQMSSTLLSARLTDDTSRIIMRFLQRLSWLSCFCGMTAFAIDFSGPLQDVQVLLNGSVVSYQVYDPGRTNFILGSANTPASYISNPGANGGVVSWLAGSTVYYRIYDPGRSNWIGGSSTATPSASISDPVSDSGLVAWLAGTAVYFAVYDPITGAWKQSALNTPGTSISNPKNSEGLVVWNADQTVYFVTYDPKTRTWVSSSSSPGSYIADIEVSTGVAAWLSGNQAYYVLYDVGRSAWRGGVGTGGFVSSVGIANSTVSWVAGTPGTTYKAGYNFGSGTWTTGTQTAVHPGFLLSTNSGNAPLFVWFTDLSLGGTGWTWNFGDGSSDNHRIPYHVFQGYGRYPVLQTVAGPTGSASASTNILTDLAAPSGSILINNGDPYTRSTAVNLTIAVSDNSSNVSSMRFSNTNNTTWSPWIPYATSYPWTLSSGDGIKSVYAQFMDPSSNLSLTLFDSITLDSRPPPIAFVTNYFVSESTPFLQVAVQLSDSTVFPVSVDFATSDGTATAGIDYASTNGRIRFNPGQTNLSFRVYITNDTTVELNETIMVNLSNPTNASIGSAGTITILDDDPPIISFATNTFTVNEGDGQARITAILNAPSGLSLSVNYASSNGTAIAGSDYTAVSGILTFAPGEISQSFNLPIINDMIDETDETVRLYLSNPTNAVLGQSSATLVIVDDDIPIAGFPTNAFIAYETAGSAAIPVKLSTPFLQPVYIDYQTSDGTAKAGTDYFVASGTLIFAPGQTNKSIAITILNNPLRQTNVTVLLSLPSMVNASEGPYTSATLTIAKDGPPRLGSFSWGTNSGFHSTLFGAIGRTYAIDRSTNLPQWQLEILRLTNTTGTVEFTDPPSAGVKQRFYRARQVN